MNRYKTLALGAVTTGAFGLIAMAAPQGGGLVVFQSGTPALASEVNANFQANEALALNALSAASRLDSITVGLGENVGLGTTDPDPNFGLDIEDLGLGNDWVGSIAAGASMGQKAVLGEHQGVATVGGHNAALNQWTDLAINPGGGNVGIGTDAPTDQLHLRSAGPAILRLEADTDNQTETDHAGILFSQDNGLETGYVGFNNGANEFTIHSMTNDIDLETNGLNRMRVTLAGNVGIGTGSPNELLDVAGNVRCVTLIETSDARLKEGIEDLDDALDLVRKLRGVSYSWDRDELPQADEGRQIGFLAQDVREVLPEVVREDESGRLAVAYSQVVPVLVEALQELDGEVASKDAEIDELRAEVERLQGVTERVEALESALTEVLATR